MAKSVSPRRAFEAQVKAHFRALTPRLDAALERLVALPASASAAFLLFEYDSPNFSRDFAVSVWPMNRRGQPTAERHRLLTGRAVVVPEDVYDDPKYESLDPWATASKLLEHWFVTRWDRLPQRPFAVIGHHDSYFKTDLKTGQRTTYDEVLALAKASKRLLVAKRKPRVAKRRARR